MKTENDNSLVAMCGLYCGNCKKFKNEKCAGCASNEKATWCKVRICCIENNYQSCADCKTSNPKECPKFSNFVSSVFEFVFRSDRPASIEYIKHNGSNAFVDLMKEQNRMVIRK